MRTGNPALTADVFRIEADYAYSNTMTLSGTILKTGFMLALVVAGAAVSWSHIAQNPEVVLPYMLGGALGGLALSLVVIFRPTTAPWAGPMYAVVKGLAVGAISFYATAYAQALTGSPYIVPQAVALTFGVLLTMLLAYSTRVIRPTETFKAGVVAATGAVFMIYLATMALGMFNISVPYIHESGAIGIGFSAFVIVLAALNLVLDFDVVERGIERGAPKHMEWYAGFALTVTLVWLYIEILRLLMKLQSRD
jgi:uncharacterized YccA/Bax inhibitor family protein